MEPLIIDSIIEKVDASETRIDEQEKVITEISQKVSLMSDQSSTIMNVTEIVKKLHNEMYNIRWPVKEMTEMSNRLAINNELLANPRKTKKVIFHTAGRLLWVIIGMFAGMVFLVMGWFNTSNKLDQFRMHDIMWRYIKLNNQSQNLEYLHAIENLYFADPDKMNSIVEKEELHHNQLKESTQINIKSGSANIVNVTDTTIHSRRKKRRK
jgi:hypothetical protein